MNFQPKGTFFSILCFHKCEKNEMKKLHNDGVRRRDFFVFILVLNHALHAAKQPNDDLLCT